MIHLIFVVVVPTIALILLDPKIDRNNKTGKYILWYSTFITRERKFIEV